MSRRRIPVTRAAAPGLQLHEAATRAEALLRERARLLREVHKKKLQLERVREQMSRDAAAASARMAPLIRRHDALIAELTSLFAELLTTGRIPARARKQISKLRRLLELRGVLPAQAEANEAEPFAPHERHEAPPPHGPGKPPGARPAARPSESAAPEVAGAKQVGQQRRSLRELFRSLVKAIHPDQARKDAERDRRTQVMKEVTRAYEEGDLARLLELETSWQTEQAISEQADSVARCRALEQINRELLDQVRRLTREIRDLKREAAEESLGLAPDELVERASRELDELEEICRFIESFRDGRLSVAELERGPGPLRDVEDLELLEQLFSDFFEEEAPRRPRGRRRNA